MQPVISVIICTHNPRRDYLDRVLHALKIQTLTTDFWELLLIDNASGELLSQEINISWHSQSRHIREENLGLTSARLRGIQEAVGEIIIFVDDDNVLDSNYLEFAYKISSDFPLIGAWGGQVVAEMEVEPPEWTKPELKNYLFSLACREFEQNKWSNLLHQHETTPCGAGLCLRKVVAQKYAELVRNDPKRKELDRKGKLLTSCGDTDMAYTACDVGLGTGQFTSLKLTHLISPNRLQEDYLVNLAESMSYSGVVLDSLRGKSPPQLDWRFSNIYLLYVRLRYGARKYRFYKARHKGFIKAIKDIANK